MSTPLTPDFDCRETPVGLVSARSDAGGRLVRLAWADGHQSRLHAIWLRDNATDPGTFNAETREAHGDLTAFPADPRVETVRVDGEGALVVRWGDERTTASTRRSTA